MTVHTFVCGYFTVILNLEPSPGRFLDIFERIFRSSLCCDPLERVSHVKKRIPVDHNGHIAYRTSTRHLGRMTSKLKSVSKKNPEKNVLKKRKINGRWILIE